MAFKDCFKEFPVLETERLVLGPLNEDDAPAMCRQLQQFPANTSWTTCADAWSVESSRNRIKHHAAAFKRKGNIHWAIRKKGGKSLIGVCKLFDFVYQSKAEAGYWIGKKYWNQGYATEALNAAVDFGFSKLELHRIYGTTDPTNFGSIRVMEKAGFQREGLLRLDARRGDTWRDSVILAILKEG